MTLVEVIVAMALFAIVMVTVFTALLITNVMNNVSKEFSDASSFAQNEMEIIYDLSISNSLADVQLLLANPLDVDKNFGYICLESTCSKTRGDFDFEIRFVNDEDSIATKIVVEVVSTKGDYAGDRAQVENHVIFGAGN